MLVETLYLIVAYIFYEDPPLRGELTPFFINTIEGGILKVCLGSRIKIIGRCVRCGNDVLNNAIKFITMLTRV